MSNVVFNINHCAEVVLRQQGADWLNSVENHGPVKYKGCWKAGDIYKDQLWCIIQMFGPKMFMWEPPFKTEIRLCDETVFYAGEAQKEFLDRRPSPEDTADSGV